MSGQTPHAHSVRNYLVVFALLCALTAAELGVVYVPGISRGLLISALVLLAVGKAALVLFSYMHLSSETKALKLTVVIPLCLPPIFAIVLMADAVWRRL
ncbi:MAG: cytochrome C oxidase subunit IV family protein [Deltaproteobacteria bacterium]|nr:cytochrome C oxidase subunit IV family protein [Deltaproteobacteria bacterium]